MKEVPEFPPSIPIDGYEMGFRDFYKGVPYQGAPNGPEKEYWKEGWLQAKNRVEEI